MDDYESWKQKRTARLEAEHSVRLKEQEKQEEQQKQRAERLDAIIKNAIAQVIEVMKDRQPSISDTLYYGAFAIHPRNLVTWYIFPTDRDLSIAELSGLIKDIDTCTRHQLQKGEYPSEGLQGMKVCFASEEEIARFQRETGLSRFHFFK